MANCSTWMDPLASLEQELERWSRAAHRVASEWVTDADVDTAALALRARRLRAGASATAARSRRAGVELTGSWVGEEGLIYRLDQYGDRLVFEEWDDHGVMACGEGIVDGAEVWLDIESADGSEGEATLSLGEGCLAGECVDHESGCTSVVRLHRREVC